MGTWLYMEEEKTGQYVVGFYRPVLPEDLSPEFVIVERYNNRVRARNEVNFLNGGPPPQL